MTEGLPSLRRAANPCRTLPGFRTCGKPAPVELDDALLRRALHRRPLDFGPGVGPPAAKGDARPDELDHAKGPGARQESIQAGEHAPGCEPEHEPGCTRLQRVHRHHERECEYSERCDCHSSSGSCPVFVPALEDAPRIETPCHLGILLDTTRDRRRPMAPHTPADGITERVVAWLGVTDGHAKADRRA